MLLKIIRRLGLSRLIFPVYVMLRKICCFHKTLPSLQESVTLLENFSHRPNNGAFRDNQNIIDDNSTLDLDIIVPCYNAEKYLHRCIDSILCQRTNFSYRIICIDDGSTDSTGKILDNYAKDGRVMVIHQANKGFSGARNTGIDLIQAKYTMFVDSDDFLPENTIEILLGKAYKKNADIVQGSFETVDLRNRSIKKYISKEKQLSIYDLTGYPWGKVILSRYIKNIKFPEDYWFEDSVMVQVLFPYIEKSGGVLIGLTETVYCYRVNPEGISSRAKTFPKAIDTLYITLRLHKDRECFDLENNQKYYEFILSTIYRNFYRTIFVPEEIKRAMFVVFSDFIKNNFKDFKANKTNNKILEKAIYTNDYNLYYAACKLF